MKKNNKEFEEKLSKDLEQYYNDIEVPELSIKKQEELKNLVKQNKPKRKRWTLWQRITAVASAVCLVALIIIPTVIMLNKNDNPQTQPPTTPPIYYGKAEAIKTPHNLQETEALVNTYFQKYNFMFTDLTYISSKGFYHPENNSLLALQIIFNEKEIPLQVEIHLIASNQFVLDNKEAYTKDAQYTKTENYELYKISYQDLFTEYERGYIIFQDYEIYINLARINENLFNKFI